MHSTDNFFFAETILKNYYYLLCCKSKKTKCNDTKATAGLEQNLVFFDPFRTTPSFEYYNCELLQNSQTLLTCTSMCSRTEPGSLPAVCVKLNIGELGAKR